MDPFDYIVPGIVFVMVVGSLLKMVLGRFPGAVTSGVVTGLLGWFLFSTVVGGIAAFIAFILTLVNLDNLPVGSGGGGFSSGGSSSSSSSDWGGGGGSFGGGGSSGSW